MNEELTKRLAAMREEKDKQLKKRAMVKRYVPFATGALCVLLMMGVISVNIFSSKSEKNGMAEANGLVASTDTSVINSISNLDDNDMVFGNMTESGEEEAVGKAEETETEVNNPETIQVGDKTFKYGYVATYGTAITMSEEALVSEFAVLVNLEEGAVVAKKASLEKMYPASMTKVLTVLVAAENINLEEELDNTVIITQEITDYSYSNGCSSVGYLVDEKTTVKDLFYGTILPSGGDAAYALACYVSGSQEAFVELMNKKVEELGLSRTTHFTNCVGLYNKEHYTTAYDMAMILKAAVENDFVREVTSAHRYTTTPSTEHPEGISLSNLFLRRIEDRDTSGEVISAKTGFVNQSGSCAASYFIAGDGVPYICVTGNSSGSWQAIKDHTYIYSKYTQKNKEEN